MKITEKSPWALMENGYVHTPDLDKAGAEEMLERYTRLFPDIEYHITQAY